MDLMGDLQDVIFRNYYTVADENDNKSSVHRSKVSVAIAHIKTMKPNLLENSLSMVVLLSSYN